MNGKNPPDYCIKFINTLLGFKLTYDVQKYLVEKTESRWREFEAEQHESDYPIKGTGIIVDQNLLNSWTFQEETILHLEEDLGPEDTGAELGNFPQQEVSIVYIYSLLEEFGNTICDQFNPSYRKIRQAWHHGVYADCDLENPSEFSKAKNAFCRPFKFETNKVPDCAIEALVRLKKERNKIVHELMCSRNFELIFRCIVIIACSIYFQMEDSQGTLKIFPWHDYNDKFRP
jgi:hypothetical protein